MAQRNKNRTGTLLQRADGRWEMKFRAPDGTRFSIYAKTKALLKEKAAFYIAQLKNAERVSNEVATVEQLLKRYLAYKKTSLSKPLRPTTYRRYEECARLWLVPLIGKKSLWSLSAQDVEEMMEQGLRAGQSSQSVIHHKAVLRAALNYAIKKEWIYRNVADRADSPKVQRREVVAMTLAKAQAMLASFEGDRLEALFRMNIMYGARQSEFLGLQWQDIDFDEKVIRIQRSLQLDEERKRDFYPTKTDSSARVIPLDDQTATKLKEHRTRQREEYLRAGPLWQGAAWNDLVFVNEIGQPLAGYTVTRRFRRLLKNAGLADITYNQGRNGFISMLAALGVPAKISGTIAGHAQISTTMDIYARVAPESSREAIDKLADALWEKTS